MRILARSLRAWLRDAFTGSTLLEAEWWPGNPKRGGLLRIPGHYPERERSFWWRLAQTVRNSLTLRRRHPMKRIRNALAGWLERMAAALRVVGGGGGPGPVR